MPDTSHDPPVTPAAQALEAHLDALRGPGFEKYALIAARLNMEPILWIERLRQQGTRTPADGGRFRPMSFRAIAPVLAAEAGVAITYETVRRWWDLAYPNGHPVDAAARSGPDAAPAPVVGPSRTTVRRTPGRTRAQSTNPAIPAATFLPPTDGAA